MSTTQSEHDRASDRDPTTVYQRMQGNDEFQGLRQRYRGFAFPMTLAFLVWYLLYVLCSNYASGFMSTKVIGNLNVAFVFGILQIVSTFLIAWAYSRHAASNLDEVASKLKGEVEEELR